MQRREGCTTAQGKGGGAAARGRAGRRAARRERACAVGARLPLRYRRAGGEMSTCSVSKVRSGREGGGSPGNSAACAGAGPAASPAASCACSSSRLLQPLPFPPPWCPGSWLPCSAARPFPKPCWLCVCARARFAQGPVCPHRSPTESWSLLGWKRPTRTVESSPYSCTGQS